MRDGAALVLAEGTPAEALGVDASRVVDVLVVVVDSATPAVTAGLVRVDDSTVEVIAERVTVDARAHGELLAPEVAEVLWEGGVEPSAVGAVVAGVGPGPFTGLRVGLVTAAAMSQALGVPAYGVCSLDALAHGQPDRVLAATDARRKELYWAVYDNGLRVAGPDVAKPDVVAREAATRHVDRAVGAGSRLYAGVLAVTVAAGPDYPRTSALAALAAERIRDRAPSEPLTPLYLRRPDAVVPGERKPALT
jgi:tRNA threonylcarbamoyl adenosine modification protein YeaZ